MRSLIIITMIGLMAVTAIFIGGCGEGVEGGSAIDTELAGEYTRSEFSSVFLLTLEPNGVFELNELDFTNNVQASLTGSWSFSEGILILVYASDEGNSYSTTSYKHITDGNRVGFVPFGENAAGFSNEEVERLGFWRDVP